MNRRIETFRADWNGISIEIRWEPKGINAETRATLEKLGHRFAEQGHFMGDAEAIMIEPGTGARLGASDPRLGGMPFFYWYQLLWIPISVAITYIVYRWTRGER